MAETVAETIIIEIKGNTGDAVKNINTVTTALKGLNRAVASMGGLGTKIQSLTSALKALEVSKLNQLASSLKYLSGTRGIGNKETAVRIGEIAEAIRGLKDLDVTKLNEMSSALMRLRQATKNAPRQISVNAPKATETLKKDFGNEVVASRSVEAVGDAAESAGAKVSSLGQRVEKLGSGAKNIFKAVNTGANAAFGGIIAKIKNLRTMISRRILYRLINSIISGITKAAKEGIQAVYLYSRAWGGTFAKSMDTLATSYNYLKASLGASLSPIITMITPYIDRLIDKFVDLLNIINQVIARLNGASTWTKAIKNQITYNDTLKNTSKRLKEIKKSVLGIDELNQLTDNRNSSGGSGSSAISNMRFEEVPLNTEEVDKIIEKLKKILEIVGLIGIGIEAWKFGKALAGLTSVGAGSLKGLSLAAGSVITATGVTLSVSGIIDFINDGAKIDQDSLTKFLSGALGIGAGGALIGNAFGHAGTGAGIGFTIGGLIPGVTGAISGFKNGASWESYLASVLGFGASGAGIGSMIGGPWGALIGGLGGGALGTLLTLGSIYHENKDSVNAYVKDKAGKAKGFVTDKVSGLVQWGYDVADPWIEDKFSWLRGKWDDFWGIDHDAHDVGIFDRLSEDIRNAVMNGFVPEDNPLKAFLDEHILGNLNDEYDSAGKKVTEYGETTKRSFRDAAKSALRSMFGLETKNKSVWKNMSATASDTGKVFSNTFKSINTWFGEDVEPIADKNASLWQTITGSVTDSGGVFSKTFDNINTWFGNKVKDPLTKDSKSLWGSITTGAEEARTGVETAFSGIGKWIKDNIEDPVSDDSIFGTITKNAETACEEIKKSLGGIPQAVEENVSSGIGKITDFLNNPGGVTDKLKSGIMAAFKTVANNLATGINNSVVTPLDLLNQALRKLKAITIGGIRPFADVPLIGATERMAITMAEGGVVDAGTMFIAGEAGAEVVASMGNKSGVMNVDQMREGVAEGVAEANAEQNAILREQNQLLRAILAKDNGGNMSADMILNTLGRWNRRVGMVASVNV